MSHLFPNASSSKRGVVKLNGSGDTARDASVTVALADGGTGATSASGARTALGLLSMAEQAASAVAITGGAISGITDLAVADGGTGSSTAAGARTNLGLALGSDVQAYDADLAAIAALSSADNNFIVGSSGGWVAESGATARASLGLTIGTDVQAYDATLAGIAGLSINAGDLMIYATGTETFATATLSSYARTLLDDANASGARTTLGLGTGDSPTFTNLTTSGSASVGSDLTVAGNLIVTGARTVVGGEKTAFADNYLDLNASYTTDAAQSCGMTFSYDPTTTATTVAGAGFTAGVASTSNPTVITTGSGTFAVGAIVRIQGSTSNDGYYEVLSHTGTTLTIRGIGTSAALEDWTGNQFATEAAAGSITQVNVAIFQVNTAGKFRTAYGANTASLSYVNVQGEITAANGLTIDANNVLNVGAGSGILSQADAVAVDFGETADALSATIEAGDTQSGGASNKVARADHQHAVATAAPSALTAGTPTVGTSSSLARADHQHGSIPANNGDDLGSSTLGWDVYAREEYIGLAEKTANYTITAGDNVVLCDPTAGAFTITLPAIAAGQRRRRVTVKNHSASANNITLAVTGADTIDGDASVSIPARASVTLICPSTGTDWAVV